VRRSDLNTGKIKAPAEDGRTTLTARLHPLWVGGRDGYRYSVLFEGKLLVDRSRDPECDAARALLAKGITGKLTMLDGKSGRPRIIVDIEKAARLTVEETGGLPRFRKYRERGGSEGYSREKDQAA
jgi:hypothetical protein